VLIFWKIKKPFHVFEASTFWRFLCCKEFSDGNKISKKDMDENDGKVFQ
jgi:hypothetical protein